MEKEEATQPTVESEDGNQAHSEVTKESRTAQPALPASVSEKLPEPMEVERNDTMLADDSMMLEGFRKRVAEGLIPTEAGVSQESKQQKVEPAKQAPASSGSVWHPPLFAGRVSSEVEDFHNEPDLDIEADDAYEELMEDKFGEEEAFGKEQYGEPPKLSEEELNIWDEESSLEELNRLSKLGKKLQKRTTWIKSTSV